MTASSPRALTLLRTAAGSPPTVTQYRAFQELGCRIVAVDCDPSSVGFAYADASYVVPRVGAADYLDRMVEVCRLEAVDLFLPALDEELVLCSLHRARFEALGTRLLVSGPGALEVCTDKLRTYSLFQGLGIPTPRTVPAEDYREGLLGAYPLVVKPRSGRGGVGVHLARNHREATFFASYVERAVVQEHCAGEELTLDVLADLDSEVLILSPRRRLAVDSGISSKGMTCWREELLEPTRRLVRTLGLVGPVNIQCFVADQVRFTEINARMAGTAILSQAAGVPYFQGILDLAAGLPPEPWLKPATPMVMYRYWEECYRTPPDEVGSCP
jgi:carbamoyl-phosphate synthase large subunit